MKQKTTQRRRRCSNCNELYPKTRENRKFCSDACRKEWHRHAGAFGPLQTACNRYIEKLIKQRAANFEESNRQAKRILAAAERLLSDIRAAGEVLADRRRELATATATLRAAREQAACSAALLAKSITLHPGGKITNTTTNTTTTTTNRDKVAP